MWLYLVVFAVGSVQDGIVFGCMHALVFLGVRCMDPCILGDQVILHPERRKNLEDKIVKKGR